MKEKVYKYSPLGFFMMTMIKSLVELGSFFCLDFLLASGTFYTVFFQPRRDNRLDLPLILYRLMPYYYFLRIK